MVRATSQRQNGNGLPVPGSPSEFRDFNSLTQNIGPGGPPRKCGQGFKWQFEGGVAP
ncbi:MAG: hypothetical protein CM15mP74_10890 [Halieaceae bacterium]|nr:MAG: hypothetical protein CM15mP74_10890 [Halieaceae bacterium]